MIKFENQEVVGWEHALRGMRNPLASWDKSDSELVKTYWDENNAIPEEQYYQIGENDLDLATRLANAGSDHRKYLRMITLYIDITAPRLWWTEFDTYRFGVEKNSCSTMHTIHKKPFTLDDFSLDETIILDKKPKQEIIPIEVDEEIWKHIDGIPHAMVSNTGKVKTEEYGGTRSDGIYTRYKEKEISVHEDSGYMNCSIRVYGKTYHCKLHRLMAEAFIPKVDGKPHINHKDGNKLNNNLSNLEWVSMSENSQHAQDNGLVFWTSEARETIGQSSRTLNDKEILEILSMRLQGYTLEDIAKKYDTSVSIISRVCTGQYFSKKKTPLDVMQETIDELNTLRELFIKTKNKKYWRMMIEMLPQSYNQKRTCMISYEALRNMYQARKNHKLDEWVSFTKMVEELPYSELIVGK